MNKPDENSDDEVKGVVVENDGSAQEEGVVGGVVQVAPITEADGDGEQVLTNPPDVPLPPSPSSSVADGTSHVDEPRRLQQFHQDAAHPLLPQAYTVVCRNVRVLHLAKVKLLSLGWRRHAYPNI